MEAIFVLLSFDLVLLFISLFKKDSTLILFSGLMFIITSFNVFKGGFGDLNPSYPIAWLLFALGIYIIVRTGLDMVTLNKNKKNRKEVDDNGIHEEENC
jgi:hypothetical protein